MIFLLVPVFALADRLIGWGGFGRTKPVIAAALLTALVAYLAGHNWYVVGLIPVAFLIWRTPGWGVFGGSLNPEGSGQVAGTFFRHLMAGFFVVPAYFAGGVHMILAGMAAVLFAGAATALAVYNAAAYRQGKDMNDEIEIIRGAVLGLFMAVAFAL